MRCVTATIVLALMIGGARGADSAPVSKAELPASQVKVTALDA